MSLDESSMSMRRRLAADDDRVKFGDIAIGEIELHQLLRVAGVPFSRVRHATDSIDASH
jgi:hypothetical protein